MSKVVDLPLPKTAEQERKEFSAEVSVAVMSAIKNSREKDPGGHVARQLRGIISVLKEELALDSQEVKELLPTIVSIELGEKG